MGGLNLLEYDKNAVGAAGARGEGYGAVLDGLTRKQHEVLNLVAENFTSKEIAFELGISESAVNQRIETVRSRAGFPPRAELARVYRKFLQDKAEVEAGAGALAGGTAADTRRLSAGKNVRRGSAKGRAAHGEGAPPVRSPLVRNPLVHQGGQWSATQCVCAEGAGCDPDRPGAARGGLDSLVEMPGSLAFGEASERLAGIAPTPTVKGEGYIVPALLDGRYAGLHRFAAIVVIAGGLLLVTAVGLGVVQTLTTMV